MSIHESLRGHVRLLEYLMNLAVGLVLSRHQLIQAITSTPAVLTL